VRIGDEQSCDEVLLAGLHAGTTLAAALLRPIGRQRHPLDVARMRDGDDHVLALDQVLVLHLAVLIDDDGPAGRRIFGLDGDHLVLDDRLDAGPRSQDVQIVGDLGGELVELVLDLVAAQRGQALQAQVEDRPRLLGGQPEGAVGIDLVTRIVDQQDQRLDVAGRPVAGHQGLTRLVGVARGADQADHLVDIGDRDGEADENVSTVARLVE